MYQYPTMYNQYFNQQQQPQYQSYQSYPQQKVDIVKVNGRNGADAYQLAPNSSILLLDESSPIVWLKTTDGAGYPTCTPYSITPYQPEPVVDTKTLEQRVTKLEEMLNEKSNSISNEYKTNDGRKSRASKTVSNNDEEC